MSEQAMLGWKAIAHFFHVSERKMRGLKTELEAAGVIFYMKVGRPPRKRVCAFPSLLQRWVILKTMKSEVI